MKEGKKISLQEFNKILSDYFNSLERTDAPYYLKYPFLDMHIEYPIKGKKFKAITKANKVLHNTLAIQQAMNLLLGNYSELQDLIKVPPDPWKAPNTDIDLYKTMMARKLSNLFSSCYAYTEHSRQLLHEIKSCPSFKSLKKRHITDDCAILEEVRNYTQHFGLPIHRIKFDKNKVELFVSTERMKNAKERNKTIIDKYEDAEVNLTHKLPLYVLKLWELHNEMLNNLTELRESSSKTIQNTIEEMKRISQKDKLAYCDLVENLQNKHANKSTMRNFVCKVLNIFQALSPKRSKNKSVAQVNNKSKINKITISMNVVNLYKLYSDENIILYNNHVKSV